MGIPCQSLPFGFRFCAAGMLASVDGAPLARVFFGQCSLAVSGHLFGLYKRRFQSPLAIMLSAR